MGYPSMNQSYTSTTYNVTPCSDRRKNGSVKYIVVHYTGTSASAKNNCQYFCGGNRNASADYFIDKDGSIYKYNGNCACFYSWHCGDGYGRNGITNANSIGIEVVSAGEEFTSAQKSSLKALIDAICADYGVSKNNIKRHYDASGKWCPAPYAGDNNAKWNTLLSYLKSSGSTVLKKGSKGDSVYMYQYALKVLGYASFTPDGSFGAKTEAAVKAFQKANGIGQDGMIGKKTTNALPAALIKKLNF